jgi:hypothetical protein
MKISIASGKLSGTKPVPNKEIQLLDNRKSVKFGDKK